MAPVGLMSAQQLDAARLFGAVEVERGGVRMVEPAYGRRAIRALLHIGYVQDDVAMARILKDAGVTREAAKLFKQNKVVVRHLESDGRLEVVPNIPGITDDNLSEYADTEACYGGEQVAVVDDRPLKYKLNQVLTDVTLADKLRLSPRRMQVVRRLAVSDPSQAASTLTEYLKENGFPYATVTAGDYARSIGRTREIIRQFANTIVYRDAAASAVVTNSDIHITFDGFEENRPLWTVRGPLKYATEVQAVYQLAIHYGPDRLMFLLGIETVFLRINIFDETRQVYYDGQLEGYSSLHGIFPQSSAMPSELTSDQVIRLKDAATKVFPVLVDGLITGSSVHVSDRHWIVNEHTLNHAVDAQKVPYVHELAVSDWRSVGNDVAMVKKNVGTSAQWVIRHADVGERVVLCFSVGDHVEYTEVLRVQSVTSEHLFLSESSVLRKGASGAAVIALRDSALLGIFSTVRNSAVVCSIFDSSIFSQITDFESVVSSEYPGTPGVAVGNLTYDRMIKRGLQGFLEGIDDAVAPLYVAHNGKKHQVGLVANVADRWQTTVDPNQEQLLMSDSRMLSFRTDVSGRYSVVAPPPVLKPLPNVRHVVPGERVFGFTKSGVEVAMTSVKVVTHCLSDNQGFVVEDFGDGDIQMISGLIVAERDAAVVGQVLNRQMDSYGQTVMHCVSMYVSPSPTAVVSSTVLISDLCSWTSVSETAIHDLSAMGLAALRLAAEQLAYRRGASLVEAGQQAIALWDVKHEYIVESMGLQHTDWNLFMRYSRRHVAEAYVALIYIADPGGFSERIRGHLVEYVQERTPIVGEFPFPRPISATGSVTSRNSRADLDVSQNRIAELENKFEALLNRLGDAAINRE